MRHLKQTLLCCLFLSGLFACGKDEGNSNNVITKNGIQMSAANERQASPVVSPATGTVNVTYNKVTKLLTYTITWANLTSDSVTGSHIHGTATKEQSVGVKHDFTSLIPKTRSGTFTNSVTIDGVAIKEDSMLKGFYYFNIHTNRYKSGEIRGQLEFN